MKFLITAFMLLSASQTFAANCRPQAGRIADEVTQIFNIGAESELHCQAVGGRTSLRSLPVIMVMPARYSYVAEYYYPCGPAPRQPRVELTLNDSCKLVSLKLKGFEL